MRLHGQLARNSQGRGWWWSVRVLTDARSEGHHAAEPAAGFVGPQCDGKSEDYGQGRSRRDSVRGLRRRSVPDAVGTGGFGGRPPVTVGAGDAVYRIGGPPCSGMGLRWSDGELNAAMDGRVAAVLFDDEGKADIEEILAPLAETEFEQAGLRRVLKDPNHLEDWRVGEAIAEAYLTDHRSCTFPWLDGRDERKSGSSLPGADLVGFGNDRDGDCFAFGEVKTSREERYPPGTMRGRTGLKKQLEDLHDRNAIRDDLVRYLGHRAGSAVVAGAIPAGGEEVCRQSVRRSTLRGSCPRRGTPSG